ncbi:MAG: hypothetical protein R3332_03050 [Pseudohongiellaceae bacterium]|nr:hypothetical protein [Pseudohongiellaceae bacterium]
MAKKFSRIKVLKLLCLAILFLAVSLGAVEALLLIDIGGIDFAVTFLLFYFAVIRDTIAFKYQCLKDDIRNFLDYVSGLYMFRPKIFLSHLSASGLIVAVTASVFFACVLWLPVIYLSSGVVA